MIVAVILVITSGIFFYVGQTTSNALHKQLDPMSTAELNYTQIISNTIDKVPASYEVLKWGSIVLIVGMILSIFISSYLVTSKPIFFVPYIIFVFMAVILAVIMANAYDEILNSSNDLAITLQSFVGTNLMLLYLPMITGAVGVIGGIIMFASYKLGQEQSVYVQ
jgi:uncharacterized protein YacL